MVGFRLLVHFDRGQYLPFAGIEMQLNFTPLKRQKLRKRKNGA